MTEPSDIEDTGPLAAALGMASPEFVLVYGLFERVEVESDDVDSATWWGSGSPIQVLLGLDERNQVWVAQPRLAFPGGIPVMAAHQPQILPPLEKSASLVDRVAATSRRRFRYCRRCRVAHGPEYFNADSLVCDGCAARSGVVF